MRESDNAFTGNCAAKTGGPRLSIERGAFDIVFEVVSDPLILIDPDGASDDGPRILRANSAFCDVLRISQAELAGRPLSELPEAAVPLRLEAFTDVAGQRRLLGVLDADPAEQADAAALAHIEHRLLAQISHDLRTPLNAIMGFAQVLREEMFGTIGDERYREYAASIVTAGRNLVNQVEELLSLRATGDGAADETSDAFAVEPVLLDRVSVANLTARDKKVRVTPVFSPVLPALHGREGDFAQMIDGVLTNAIQAAPAKSRIILTAEGSDDDLVVTCSDHGEPLPSDCVVTNLVSSAVHRDPYTAQAGRPRVGLGVASSYLNRFGARLTFGAGDPTGSRIRIHIPVEQDQPRRRRA